jgi:23S rRNA U2552 (ribose-2'-O)-methylase RlmE/FtsJ
MLEFQIPAVSAMGGIVHIAGPVIPSVAISTSLHKYLEDIRIPVCERIDEWYTYSRFAHGFCKTVAPVCSALEILVAYNLASGAAPMNILTIFSSDAIHDAIQESGAHIIAHARKYRDKDRYLRIKPDSTSFALTRDWTAAPLSVPGLAYFASHHGNTMDLVFAEIAPNYGLESREVHNIGTIFAHVVYAVCMQRAAGSFVLSIADIFREHTIDVLVILSALYTSVRVVKPSSSRADMAERFVVCQNFRPDVGANMYPYLHKCFADMVQVKRCPGIYTHRLLSMRIPCFIIDKIEELNAVLGQQQLENLKATISLIDNKHRDAKSCVLARQQTEMYEKWRVVHGICA